MFVNDSSKAQVIQSLFNKKRLIKQGQYQDQGSSLDDLESLGQIKTSFFETNPKQYLKEYESARSYLEELGLLETSAQNLATGYQEIQGFKKREDLEKYLKISLFA